MKLNYLVIFHSEIVSSPFQMSNLHEKSAWYTLSIVKWSPSIWAKLIFASSAAFFASGGLTNICEY
ncbi:hypothetical protein BpHYR1_003968 [Brachionus plicatilis]|uniref:Uncharacterized protein n=1 Tax=Brachionus plicatilis TaxID=10195 RepID=A0A3M7RY32_BRAPC|nr:hypothetical protein BpHYR1_003968 [Brachionus plicatilis]